MTFLLFVCLFLCLNHVQHSTELFEGGTPCLAHVVLQVCNQDFSHKVTTTWAKGSNAILECPSQQDKISPHGKRPHNIQARTNAAVEQHRRSAFDHIDNSG